MQEIIRNALRCKLCGDIIESKSRHDFRRCKCGKCFIDGGHDYIRAGFDNPDDIEWMTETIEVPGYHVSYAFQPNGTIYSFDTTRTPEDIKESYSEYPLKIENEDRTKVLFDSFGDRK